MIYFKCQICNASNLNLNLSSNKSINYQNLKKNLDKYNLKLIQEDQENEIVGIHKCRRCGQKILFLKNSKTKVIETHWYEYLCKLKIIEKDLNHTYEELEFLKKTKKIEKDLIKNKIQRLSQNYEIYKLQKESLKHRMMASVSIKLHSWG
tara:strand:+ start:169 stop:618 length:450 start_codon:yes stop_codon:yes gene_type:complete